MKNHISKRLRKKKAIKGIERSFLGVTLGSGVSLHETLEVDDYGDRLPNSKARSNDEIYDWTKLINSPNLIKFCWNGGITFFDGEGFKFHLPAYLITDIRTNQLGDIASTMIDNLVNPASYRARGFSLFSLEQKQAVLNAILYLHDFESNPLEKEELTALYRLWS